MFRPLLLIIAAVLIPSGAGSQAPTAALMAYADPAAAGFNTARLDEARMFADKNGAAAVVALYRGRAIAAWGAVDRPLMAHSIRKSLAGALYGIAVAGKRLALDATLADLGLDDEPPLTAGEKQARVRDLIAARSGVYHDAAYASADQAGQRPERGSHAPGTFWFYNNWDFNAAETIYQRATGEDLYTAFNRLIAGPIGMEDFDPAGQLRVIEPSHSRLPAHTFRISARDLARFGQLYLQEGRWDDRQIVPRDWVRESLRAHSMTGPGTGYGYLWWTYEPGSLGTSYPVLNRMAIYLGRGTGGQALFVIPSAEMVVVHRADTDNGRPVGGAAIWQLVERLVAAREQEAAARPALEAMKATPLASQLPAPPPLRIVALGAAALERLAGDYESGGAVVRVFLYDGRLFMNLPGQGEAELFATGPLSFAVRVAAGVSVQFREDSAGRISGVVIALGPKKIEGVRR
jgi:CubicO group peptidase (beta-lactamase class C family)